MAAIRVSLPVHISTIGHTALQLFPTWLQPITQHKQINAHAISLELLYKSIKPAEIFLPKKQRNYYEIISYTKRLNYAL